MAMPSVPPLALLGACLVALAWARQACSDGVDGTCATTETSGSILVQRRSSIRRDILELEVEGSCAPFESWPNVDNGVTCSDCTALVLTAPYGGRCDKYCESFGHVCTAAAEERDESCQELESKRCDEEIRDTSDMLCTCEQQGSSPTPSPAPIEAVCYGELPGLAVVEGSGVGKVSTQSASDCKRGCSESGECQSASFCPGWNGCWLKDRSFSGGEAVKTHGDCKTFYKKPCDGGATPAPRPTPPPSTGGPKIKVVSYNLFWWNAFGQNPWKGEQVTKNIKNKLGADVLGLQECDSTGLIESRTGYSRASKFSGAQGVMVKPGLFTVGDHGSRDIGATGKWGPRYVTWAQLTHMQSGRTFWHFNTHWCVHSGNGRTCSADKRYTGAKNMLKVIREKAGDSPVIITGDFNAGRGEAGPQYFLQNGFSLAEWNWVDGVFYSTAHWQTGFTGTGEHAESDHRPVIAELELK